MSRIPQSIIHRSPVPKSKKTYCLLSINKVVFPCVSIVHSLKKVLKLLTSGSEDTHLIHICVKHVSIFNCFYKKGKAIRRNIINV